MPSTVRVHKELMSLKCSKIRGWSHRVSLWSSRWPLEAFCSLTPKEGPDLHCVGSRLIRGTAGEMDVCNGQATHVAEGRGVHYARP